MQYFISYQVIGAGPQKVGPYDEAEAKINEQDIAGYEGISDVKLIPCQSPEEKGFFTSFEE